MTGSRFVIVGGGAAAASAAAALRRAGYDGAVTVVSAEGMPPYERPPLSKGFLTGACGRAELLLHPPQWYDENGVELVLDTRAESVDVPGHVVRLTGGRRIAYDRLLLATGGTARRLPVPESERVLCLREVGDAEALAGRLAPGDPLVVVGGGFIGCEIAASARELGVDVTMLEAGRVPLQRVLGDQAGSVVAELHRERGVTVRTGETIETIESGADGAVVHTTTGPIECATVVVALGLTPATGLAAGAGIAVDEATGGILVDRFCRTSAPDVYAAGDVAAHEHPAYPRPVRVEHHDHAVRQGAAAARSMLHGDTEPYDDLHWFWSDQYEFSLQQIGRADGCDGSVVRGSLDERCFSVVSLADGRARSVFAFDRATDILGGRRLIASGRQVTATELADTSVSLKKLATAERERT
ncbi:NAD(P)/FAD-dependent oxidoreductase [Pseudonocardia endophytica]|uniref:3-phenylpropionate/trans-cinnamate dioxygenase ferredoxin reductase subunit n=1 Tax=Pseudonocardia endophytica TaxID=401976 RepID=A0A4R1I965_PSEEN|nr:FAD-dependent oxidoreductase [Pseudonocardia endophytica]TCK26762.1 3-phenylpropionate/trans-cinnamate dioxygenase ferredoxin reductase subunit [Pseudonocardia endophytica]